MTLLSIREQEAVREARLNVRRDISRYAMAMNYPGNSVEQGKACEAAEAKSMALVDAYAKAVILATRNAIARQVREEALDTRNRLGIPQEALVTWHRVATFIEGMGV